MRQGGSQFWPEPEHQSPTWSRRYEPASPRTRTVVGASEAADAQEGRQGARPAPSSAALRNAVLVLLVVQTTAIVLLMSYSRTVTRAGAGPPYRPTVAVLMAEAFKLPVCVAAATWVVGGVANVRILLREQVLGRGGWKDTLKCAVPALAYTVQNNLLFVALGHLDAPTFQVTYQCKTAFTALFSWLVIGRVLKPSQWAALAMLTAGTVLVSDLHTKSGAEIEATKTQSRAVGLAAVLSATVLSGASAVYLEMMLKKPAVAGLWLRNIQLGLFACPLAAATVLWNDGAFVAQHGLLHGFGRLEWAVVLVNGVGGLLIAAVMKHAGSIEKCFASATAIVSGTALSVPIFGFTPSRFFASGATLTVTASIVYSTAPDLAVLRALLRPRKKVAQ